MQNSIVWTTCFGITNSCLNGWWGLIGCWVKHCEFHMLTFFGLCGQLGGECYVSGLPEVSGRVGDESLVWTTKFD